MLKEFSALSENEDTINKVLILILMEHAQRVTRQLCDCNDDIGLNPYFNGTCSKRGHFL